jgi:hypothetical protein
MGLRYALSVVFALVLITVFSLGFVSSCLSQSTEKSEAQTDGTSFRFTVRLTRIDWNARAFDAYVEIFVSASPYNLSDPLCPFLQQWFEGASYVSKESGVPIRLFSSETPGYFLGNVTTSFQLVGPTQLYPFDSYMLNLTFVLPFRVREWNVSASSIINQANTRLNIICQVGEFDWATDPATPGGTMPKFSNITYELSTASEGGEAGVEWASLSCKTILFRPTSSTNLIMVVLGICYALVGSLPLIKPDRLEYRLSVCLSLFVFAVTFTFTIPVPTTTRTTLAETLILILLTAAGMFSIVSIIEKALIEVRQRLAVCQYLAEGIILLALILQLGSSLTIPAIGLDTQAPWASVPSTLSPFLNISLFYGYIAVTLAFIFNHVRKNKSRISKRVGANEFSADARCSNNKLLDKRGGNVQLIWVFSSYVFLRARRARRTIRSIRSTAERPRAAKL